MNCHFKAPQTAAADSRLCSLHHLPERRRECPSVTLTVLHNNVAKIQNLKTDFIFVSVCFSLKRDVKWFYSEKQILFHVRPPVCDYRKPQQSTVQRAHPRTRTRAHTRVNIDASMVSLQSLSRKTMFGKNSQRWRRGLFSSTTGHISV